MMRASLFPRGVSGSIVAIQFQEEIGDQQEREGGEGGFKVPSEKLPCTEADREGDQGDENVCR